MLEYTLNAGKKLDNSQKTFDDNKPKLDQIVSGEVQKEDNGSGSNFWVVAAAVVVSSLLVGSVA